MKQKFENKRNLFLKPCTLFLLTLTFAFNVSKSSFGKLVINLSLNSRSVLWSSKFDLATPENFDSSSSFRFSSWSSWLYKDKMCFIKAENYVQIASSSYTLPVFLSHGPTSRKSLYLTFFESLFILYFSWLYHVHHFFLIDTWYIFQMGIPDLCLFYTFQTMSHNKNCGLRRDLNLDCWIRQAACWPFDHHYGSS